MRNSSFSLAFLAALGLVACAETPRDVALDSTGAALSVARSQPTLATGADHACAVRSDCLVACWGENELGQLGDATLADQLAATVRARTEPHERIYVFGFTCAAYVLAERASASRFFWSRPVIVNFRAGVPGYGVDGLIAELRQHPPSLVALQRRDWAPDVADSASFFMDTPALAGWLQAHYVRASGPPAFDVWVLRTGPS